MERGGADDADHEGCVKDDRVSAQVRQANEGNNAAFIVVFSKFLLDHPHTLYAPSLKPKNLLSPPSHQKLFNIYYYTHQSGPTFSVSRGPAVS